VANCINIQQGGRVPVTSVLKGGVLRLSLTGAYTYEEIALAFDAGLAAAGPGRARVLWDGSNAATALDTRGVVRLIALLRRCRARLSRVAVVGRSALMFGISRQIAQTLDCDDTPVQAFGDLDAAATWLRRRDSGVHAPG
jgi:hypothetical protein